VRDKNDELLEEKARLLEKQAAMMEKTQVFVFQFSFCSFL